jgi:hypothetical protein
MAGKLDDLTARVDELTLVLGALVAQREKRQPKEPRQ